MTYSEKDLERATRFFEGKQFGVEHLAKRFAAVRREALEEAAELAGKRRCSWGVMRSLEATYMARAAAEIATDIRALKDGGK